MMRKTGIFIFSIGLLAAGCTSRQQSSQPQQVITGKVISATARTTYYRENDATYVTSQSHTFAPNSQSMQITANEPFGVLTWSLSQGAYSESGTVPKQFASKVSFGNSAMTKCIHYAFLSGSGQLNMAGFLQQDPQKVQGQWYLPYQYKDSSGDIIWIYKSINTGVFQLVHIQSENRTYQARNYNPWFIAGLNHNIPKSIEIIDISKGIAEPTRLINIEYQIESISIKTI